MSLPAPKLYTLDEYLDLENSSETKHEYYYGEIFAMAGGSRTHSAIMLSFGASLLARLRGSGCKVYGSELRVRVDEGHYTYPDLSVVCGERGKYQDDPHTLSNPLVLVEVLSPSTEAYDRGFKFEQYRKIESLREYLLVSQHTPKVERFTRAEGGDWILRSYVGLDAAVELPSLGIHVPLAEIYDQAEFDGSLKTGGDWPSDRPQGRKLEP